MKSFKNLKDLVKWYIFAVSVVKELQGKGIGKSMILDAEKWAKVKGFNAVYLISTFGARGFYKKCGYKQIESGELKQYFKKDFWREIKTLT